MSNQPESNTQPAKPAPPTPNGAAVIGASMRIKGDIRSNEALFVDGEVDGTVESQHSLTVGPNGKVNATIKARDVTVLGNVQGNVEVSGRLAIRENGSLVGDIRAAGIAIDDGAYFKGSIDLIRQNAAKAS